MHVALAGVCSNRLQNRYFVLLFMPDWCLITRLKMPHWATFIIKIGNGHRPTEVEVIRASVRLTFVVVITAIVFEVRLL